MNPNPILSRLLGLGAAMLLTAVASAQTCGLLAIDIATTTTSTLWDISPTTGAASNPRTVSGFPHKAPHCIAFSPAGVLYGVSLGGIGSPASGMLFQVNPTTGAATFVANLSQYINVEGDIAFDPTTGILYAVDGGGPMFTIDTSTGVCTSLGSLPADLPGGCDYSACTFDSTGQMYVWSQFGSVLRKVDKTNATIQSTVPLAPFPGGAVGGMSFDPGTGRLFLGGNPSGGLLTSASTTTGVVTPIGATTPMAGVYGMAFNPNNCASAVQHGNGCTSAFASFYEQQISPLQDLAGKKILGTYTGSGYVITTVPGPGIAIPGGVVPLPLGDNTSLSVGSLGMWVGSNGWMSLGGGNTTAPVPSIPTLLNQPSPQLSAWTDLDPSSSGGGQVFYWEPAPGVAQATWLGVPGKWTSTGNNIQITWDLTTRDWSIEFGTLFPWNPMHWLVGYSPGGPNADPGQSDISSFGGSPHTITLFDTVPLTLAPVGRPVQGFTATPFNLVTSNIDPSTMVHVGIIGLQSPNQSLTSLGLPSDCFLHASLDILTPYDWFPASTQGWTSLTLPALPPSFVGFVFYCQSVTLTSSWIGPTTRVSNGVKCTIGTL